MKTQAKKIRVTCDKCNGSGHLAYHSNYANGVCFPCAGTGKITVRKGDRKPGFEWNDYVAKKIMFIVNIDMETLYRMTEDQVVAMDNFVHNMAAKKECMWLYRFYCEAVRGEVIKIINASPKNDLPNWNWN